MNLERKSGIHSSHRPLVVILFLIFAVFAIYGQTTRFEFISIDDYEYVRDNPNVTGGLTKESILWAFTHPVAGNWHPVTMLSHMLDSQLYGARAGWHHLTNVLLHLANSIILFFVLLALTDRKRAGEQKDFFWPCAIVVALFALHPLRVESVAWISERKDVLSGFFFVLTLWAYVHYIDATKKPIWYIAALVFFALGLMSKPMLVTLPCVLLLLDYWPLRRTKFLRLFLEKIPFFTLAVLCSAITMTMQKKAGAVVTLNEFPLNARLANAVISYIRYLGKTFWPDSLSVMYPQRNWAEWQVATAVILLGVLSALAVWFMRRRPYLFVGWFIFVGMLLPVSGIFQAGEQAMADRFCYLPLIGFFIALVWLAAETISVKALQIGSVIILLALSAVSFVQTGYWHDSRTVFLRCLQVAPENATAHHFLGVIQLNAGEMEEAQKSFTAAIRYNPSNVRARCALGYMFFQQNKFSEAAEEYEAALQVEPDNAQAHVGYAGVLAKQGRPDLAVKHYVSALQSNPEIPEAHYQIASALLSAKQDTSAAITYLQNAVRLAPDWPLPLNALAWTYATYPDAKFRNGPEAVRLATLSVSLTSGNDPGLLDTLAAAQAEAGQFDEAIKTAEAAVQKATAANQTNLAADIASHLKLYQLHQAFHE